MVGRIRMTQIRKMIKATKRIQAMVKGKRVRDSHSLRSMAARKNTSREDCPICFEPKGMYLVTMKCRHSLCFDCFVTHSRSSSKCPLCRDQFAPVGGSQPEIIETLEDEVETLQQEVNDAEEWSRELRNMLNLRTEKMELQTKKMELQTEKMEMLEKTARMQKEKMEMLEKTARAAEEMVWEWNSNAQYVVEAEQVRLKKRVNRNHELRKELAKEKKELEKDLSDANDELDRLRPLSEPHAFSLDVIEVVD